MHLNLTRDHVKMLLASGLALSAYTYGGLIGGKREKIWEVRTIEDLEPYRVRFVALVAGMVYSNIPYAAIKSVSILSPTWSNRFLNIFCMFSAIAGGYAINFKVMCVVGDDSLSNKTKAYKIFRKLAELALVSGIVTAGNFMADRIITELKHLDIEKIFRSLV